MQLISSIRKTRQFIATKRRKDKTIGFVPTMGYLHEGHLSLMRQAKRDCDVCVISIFVNPAQFSPNEDLKKYPRNINRDLALAKSVGVDAVFYPSSKAIYPEGYLTYVNVEKFTEVLCGESRPGHFRGVTIIVTKLFNIVQPDIAYFGQKDAQQAIVIKKMVQDLDMPVKIKIMPIVREPDGLAMSSRNAYLNLKERTDALVLYQSLIRAKRMIKKGERSSKKIVSAMRQMITAKKTADIDYISCVGLNNLEPLSRIQGRALIALAVFIGKTRLIDNIIVNPIRRKFSSEVNN